MNFDNMIDQHNTADEKHDQMKEYFGRDDLLPMWVAEMDFQTSPLIIDALTKRCEHGIFGYSYRTDEYLNSITDWYAHNHHCSIERDMLSFDSGVIRSLFELIRLFTKPHDQILIPVPAYAQFAKVIQLTGRKMLPYPLRALHGRFYFDEEVLMEALSNTSMMVLCSPHNPGGQIWTKEELTMIASCCERTNTVLVSDEIHSDLALNPDQFTTMLRISKQAIVLNSPSKAFNLAGLQHSYAICQDKTMQEQIKKHYEINKVKSYNTLSMLALETAYVKGDAYLRDVRAYIKENYQTVVAYIQDHQLNLPVFELEAGYLMWIDFRSYFDTADKLDDFLVNTCHIATTAGRNFHDERSGCFSRLNIATQKVNCIEAMNRIEAGLKAKGYIV